MDGMISPGIGHNSEPRTTAALDPAILVDQIKLDNQPLLTERDNLVAEVKRWFDQFPKGPTTDEECGAAADLVKSIKTEAKKAEAAHKDQKQPYLDCGRVVDAVLKQETADVLSGLARRIEAVLTSYVQAKAQREREALAEQRRKQEAETQRLLDEAAKTSNPIVADEIMAKAADAADRVDVIAAQQAGPVADMSRVRGNFGSNTALRDKWEYQVTDLMALVKAVAEGKAPIHYLQANESAIGAAVRLKDGLRELPGVNIYNNAQAKVR